MILSFCNIFQIRSSLWSRRLQFMYQNRLGVQTNSRFEACEKARRARPKVGRKGAREKSTTTGTTAAAAGATAAGCSGRCSAEAEARNQNSISRHAGAETAQRLCATPRRLQVRVSWNLLFFSNQQFSCWCDLLLVGWTMTILIFVNIFLVPWNTWFHLIIRSIIVRGMMHPQMP